MTVGQILGFSIGFRRRPYNTLALPCECVIAIGSEINIMQEKEIKNKRIKK